MLREHERDGGDRAAQMVGDVNRDDGLIAVRDDLTHDVLHGLNRRGRRLGNLLRKTAVDLERVDAGSVHIFLSVVIEQERRDINRVLFDKICLQITAGVYK